MKRFLFLLLASFSCALAAPRVANLAIVCDQDTICWSDRGPNDITTQNFIDLLNGSVPLILSNTVARRALHFMLCATLPTIKDEAQAEEVLASIPMAEQFVTRRISVRDELLAIFPDMRFEKETDTAPLDACAYYERHHQLPRSCKFNWPVLENLDLLTAAKAIAVQQFVLKKKDELNLKSPNPFNSLKDRDFLECFFNKIISDKIRNFLTSFDPERWLIYCPFNKPELVLFIPKNSIDQTVSIQINADRIGLNIDDATLLRHYRTDELANLAQLLKTYAQKQQEDGIAQAIIDLTRQPNADNPLMWNILCIGHGSPDQDGDDSKFCGMKKSEFLHLLQHCSSNIDTAIFSWTTCYGGGLAAHKIISDLRQYTKSTKHRQPILISTAAHDKPVMGALKLDFGDFFAQSNELISTMESDALSHEEIHTGLNAATRNLCTDLPIIALPNESANDRQPFYKYLADTDTETLTIIPHATERIRILLTALTITAPISLLPAPWEEERAASLKDKNLAFWLLPLPQSKKEPQITLEPCAPNDGTYQLNGPITTAQSFTQFITSAFFTVTRNCPRDGKYHNDQTVVFHLKNLTCKCDQLTQKIWPTATDTPINLQDIIVIRAPYRKLRETLHDGWLVIPCKKEQCIAYHVFEIYKNVALPIECIKTELSNPVADSVESTLIKKTEFLHAFIDGNCVLQTAEQNIAELGQILIDDLTLRLASSEGSLAELYFYAHASYDTLITALLTSEVNSHDWPLCIWERIVKTTLKTYTPHQPTLQRMAALLNSESARYKLQDHPLILLADAVVRYAVNYDNLELFDQFVSQADQTTIEELFRHVKNEDWKPKLLRYFTPANLASYIGNIDVNNLTQQKIFDYLKTLTTANLAKTLRDMLNNKEYGKNVLIQLCKELREHFDENLLVASLLAQPTGTASALMAKTASNQPSQTIERLIKQLKEHHADPEIIELLQDTLDMEKAQTNDQDPEGPEQESEPAPSFGGCSGASPVQP